MNKLPAAKLLALLVGVVTADVEAAVDANVGAVFVISGFDEVGLAASERELLCEKVLEDTLVTALEVELEEARREVAVFDETSLGEIAVEDLLWGIILEEGILEGMIDVLILAGSVLEAAALEATVLLCPEPEEAAAHFGTLAWGCTKPAFPFGLGVEMSLAALPKASYHTLAIFW